MVVLGAQKLGAVDQATLFWPLIAERLDNFLRIIGRDPSQAVFAEGWANRIAEWWRPPGAAPEADGILAKGDKGDAVERLQALFGIVADGDFGPGYRARRDRLSEVQGLGCRRASRAERHLAGDSAFDL